ncbi:MAG: hypothetical protein HQK66_10120 [Desulfamplus sp.]|nr:hypothetical protein [Desulfamplus sp.]
MTEIDFMKYLPDHETLLESTRDVLAGRKSLAQASGMPDHIMKAIFNDAKTAFAAEDYERSEKLFGLLFQLDGKDRNAQIGYAGSLEAQGKFQEALDIYLMQTITTPFDPVAPFRAGICFMELGQKKEAKDAFKMASACSKKMAGEPEKLIYARRADTMLKMFENM